MMRSVLNAAVIAAVILLTAFAPADAGGKALIAFWRSDCAPCHEELKILLKAARDNEGLKVFLVTFKDDKKAGDYSFGDLPENFHVVAAGADTAVMMKNFGDDKKALPFSLMTRADASICGHHYGVLGYDLIKNWIKTC